MKMIEEKKFCQFLIICASGRDQDRKFYWDFKALFIYIGFYKAF